MGEIDMRAARERVETVERRIAAMQDAGVDTAALRAQLAFAHHALRDGRLADTEAICDEVLDSARRLAERGSRSSQPHPAIRTPAQGTPVPAPPVRDPAAPGTEALQRVKIGRAQLADEVRAAIDAEVKSQLPQTVPPSNPDLAPLANRLEALEAQVAAAASVADHLHALDTRCSAVEQRASASLPAPDPAPLLGIARQLESVAARLLVLENRPIAVPGPAGEQLDQAAVHAIVSTAIAEAVPRQASELLREAISKLPTRDDLHQIAETLRADLDWRLEKAAAEHGWCSLADVQSTVRKGLSSQDPGTTSGGSQLGRLEIALAEFVQQSKDQQDRLISALADRVVQKTKIMTKRLLVHDDPLAIQVERHSDTEELSPSLSADGDSSSQMAAITGAIERQPPGKSPTELSLDPVPAEALEATRREHGNTTLFTQRVKPSVTIEVLQPEAAPTAVAKPEELHDLVTAAVERALHSATSSTLTDNAPTPMSDPSRSRTAAGISGLERPAQPEVETPQPALTSASTAALADLGMLVAAEVGRQLANTIPVQLPPSDSDLARAVARVLPQALQDESVRTELFAVLALEAAGKPGALGELTGLRRYLKRELQAAANQLGMTVPA